VRVQPEPTEARANRRLRAVFNRTSRLLPALATAALLPLALPHAEPPSAAIAIGVAAPAVVVEIATRPLDLAALTAADFGDNDAGR
jgi:hypothetical protein